MYIYGEKHVAKDVLNVYWFSVLKARTQVFKLSTKKK